MSNRTRRRLAAEMKDETLAKAATVIKCAVLLALIAGIGWIGAAAPRVGQPELAAAEPAAAASETNAADRRSP